MNIERYKEWLRHSLLYERRKMDKLTLIKSKIAHIFNEDVYLYNIDFITRDSMYILEIQIDRYSNPVDLDLCSEISMKISDILDEIDVISEDYYLEVCSAGAEKEIRNEKELEQAKGKYVYVKLHQPSNGIDEILGTLEDITDDEILIIHFIKGVRKKAKILKENVKYISHAVKV